MSHAPNASIDYERALASFSRCIAIDPRNWVGYMQRAHVALELISTTGSKELPERQRKELLEQSVKDLDTALELKPNLAEVHWHRGDAYKSSPVQDVDLAIKSYITALQLLEPLDAGSDVWLSGIRESRLKALVAWADKQRAASAPILAGLAHLKLGEYPAAHGQLDKAADVADTPIARAARGATFRAEGATGKAQQELEAAGELPFALHHLARTQESQQRFSEARKTYARLTELPASNAVANWMRADAYLALARLSVLERRSTGIETPLRRALEYDAAIDLTAIKNLAANKQLAELAAFLRTIEPDIAKASGGDPINQVSVLNGDFELGLTRYWSNWQTEPGFEGTARTFVDATGERSLMIESAGNGAGSISQPICVEANTEYEVKLSHKSKNFTSGKLKVYLDGELVIGKSRIPTKWDDAKETETTGPELDADIKVVELRIEFSGHGTVWIDDIKIKRIPSGDSKSKR